MPTLPAFPSRRTGRPRNPAQMLPSAVSAPLARTRVHLEIPSCTLAELDEYVAWLAALLGIPEPEARTTAVDAAIRRLVKTDPVWKKKVRADRAASTPMASPALPPSTRAAAAPGISSATDADPLGLDAPTVVMRQAG